MPPLSRTFLFADILLEERRSADHTYRPSPPGPLFSAFNDYVDFNHIVAGSYIAGTQYNALAGNDYVILPYNEEEALEAGFTGNEFNAGDGNDKIFNYDYSTHLRLYGGDGNDYIYTEGDDIVFGGNGHDVILTDGGYVYGEGGNDLIFSSGHIDGGEGDDFIYSPEGSGLIRGGAGNDVIFGGDEVYGGSGDDLIIGYWNSIFVLGEDGNDTIILHGDSANVTGGAGNDVIFAGYGYVDIWGDGGNDVIHAENIFGGSLRGGSGDDQIFLGAGNGNLTLVYGGEGTDWIFCGETRELITSRLEDYGTGIDHILDFESGSDFYAFEGLTEPPYPQQLEGFVQFQDTAQGTMLRVDIDGAAGQKYQWQDIAFFHGLNFAAGTIKMADIYMFA